VEKGGNTGRLHIHVLHIFRDLPIDCGDPNFGMKVAYKREITAMKRFWQYGFSCPKAVRFSETDSFGRRGWRWPAVQEGGVVSALQAKPLGAIVWYVGKYISKDVSKEKEIGCLWRTI